MLIFCISNLFIPATLSLVKTYYRRKIIIYTDQVGIYKFFREISFTNVEIYYRKQVGFSFKNPFTIINFNIHRKKTLNEIISMSPEAIFFFHRAFGMYENWLISKLYFYNITIYYCPVTSPLRFKKKNSIKSIGLTLIAKYFHNTEVINLWSGERYINCISIDFLKKIEAKQKKIDINKIFISSLIQDTFNIKNRFRYVLLSGSIVELSQVKKSEYICKIDQLIELLGKNNTIIKPHPRFPNKVSKENELETIDDYIPANVLFSKFNVFIGYSTTVLSEAANEGLTAISLLDYFRPTSSERREKYKDYLLSNINSGTIHFPNEINEIKLILNI